MANGLKKQKQKWKALAKHKSSLVLYLITILAAAITVFVLGYLDCLYSGKWYSTFETVTVCFYLYIGQCFDDAGTD